MTVTDPRGDPSLLQTLVSTEHGRLLQLLDEAGKDTSTPGVHDELLDQLRRFLAAHLNTESVVIHPVVQGAFGHDVDDRLARDTERIHELVRDPQMVSADEVIRAHLELSEELLSRLRDEDGGQRMATLGFEYSDVAEVVSERLPPT